MYRMLAMTTLTDGDEGGVKDVEGLPVANGLGHGIDQDGDVAAGVVHEEQEDPQDGRLDGGGDDLNQDHEQDAEPGLS